MSLTRGQRPKRPKPAIVRDLEKIRADMVVAAAVPCWECLTVPPKIDCTVCEGTGVVSDGIYDPNVMIGCFGMAMSACLETIPDTCIEARTALKWSLRYNMEAFVHNILAGEGSHVNAAERLRERLAAMGSKPHPVTRLLVALLESLPADATRDDIVQALAEARDLEPPDGL